MIFKIYIMRGVKERMLFKIILVKICWSLKMKNHVCGGKEHTFNDCNNFDKKYCKKSKYKEFTVYTNIVDTAFIC